MALVKKRLEMMRQLTKGSITDIGLIYVLIEVETNKVLGTYHDETLAENDSDLAFSLYGIDTEIKSYPIDTLHIE